MSSMSPSGSLLHCTRWHKLTSDGNQFIFHDFPGPKPYSRTFQAWKLPQYYYYYNHFTAPLDVWDSQVSRYQKSKIRKVNQSGFNGARNSEWQWHQLGHMQICTLTQTHKQASIPPGRMPFLPLNQQCQST